MICPNVELTDWLNTRIELLAMFPPRLDVLPVNVNVPLVIVVVPVYVFVPARIKDPAPCLVNPPPAPLMTPENVVLVLPERVSVPVPRATLPPEAPPDREVIVWLKLFKSKATTALAKTKGEFEGKAYAAPA